MTDKPEPAGTLKGLDHAMRVANIKPKELAIKSGLDVNYLYQIISRRRSISVPALVRLSMILGQSETFLLHGRRKDLRHGPINL